jgi:hypothetical protein
MINPLTMKKAFSLILCALISASFSVCHAQSMNISKPQLELINNNVVILYNIINSTNSDKFDISIDVTDENGNKVNARSLTGDVGNQISGGNGKEITWNLTTDNIMLDAMLYFQIRAQAINTSTAVASNTTDTHSEPVKTSTQKTTTEAFKEAEAASPSSSSSSSSSSISRGSAVFQSLLFPGLGLSRINHKPHWFRGVAGYGCVAGSVLLNSFSNTSYNSYLESRDITARNDFYNTSVKQTSISSTLLYSAIGVWVIDFIWTFAGSKYKSTAMKYGQTKGLSVQPIYNSELNTPALAFKYTF